MAVTAGTTVMYLTGDIAFLAGGMPTTALIGAFVKSIDTSGSAVVQMADGTEATVQLLASRISEGNAFPTTPEPNGGDLHIFRGAVSSGLTWKDFDGTADLTAAVAGDVALRIGSDWVKVGNLRAASTATWAQDGNTDPIPISKIPDDIARDSELPDVSNFLNQTQVDARVADRVQDWAETGNTDRIPEGKIDTAIARTSAIPDTSGFLNQAAVDARVSAGVADWAEQDNNDPIPSSKLTNAGGGGTGRAGRIVELTITGTNSVVLPTDYATYDVVLISMAEIEITIDVRDLEANATKMYRSGGNDRVTWTRSSRTLLGHDRNGVGTARAISVATIMNAGTGLSETEVDARVTAGVADWAEQGNSSDIPDSKIPDTITRDTEIAGFQSATQVDGRVRAIVENWAEVGNATVVPENKIPSVITRDAEADAKYAQLSGAAFTGVVSGSENPTSPAHLTRKDYVDGAISGRMSTRARFVDVGAADYVYFSSAGGGLDPNTAAAGTIGGVTIAAGSRTFGEMYTAVDNAVFIWEAPANARLILAGLLTVRDATNTAAIGGSEFRIVNTGANAISFTVEDGTLHPSTITIPANTLTYLAIQSLGSSASRDPAYQLIVQPFGGQTAAQIQALIASARIAETQIDGAIARDAEVAAAYAALNGATFTGPVSGVAPTSDAHLTRKDYVDSRPGVRTGGAFPASPNENDLFEFNAAATGLTAVDGAGNSVTTAGIGDLFKRIGNSWTRQRVGGLAQAAVDARVKAGVLDQAETGNTSRWPANKLPADTVYDADIAGLQNEAGVNGLIRAGVHDWAEAADTSRIPATKLPDDTVYDGDIANFQTQSEVDARVQAGVHDWAEAANTDAIPIAKLANAAVAGQDNAGGQVEDRITTFKAGNGVNLTQDSDGVVVIADGPVVSTETTYIGVSSDATISASEISGATSGNGNVRTVPSYSGAQHVFAVRPVDEGVVSAVYVYPLGMRNTFNQIASWTLVPSTNVSGANFVGVRSTAPLTGASDLVVELV